MKKIFLFLITLSVFSLNAQSVLGDFSGYLRVTSDPVASGVNYSMTVGSFVGTSKISGDSWQFTDMKTDSIGAKDVFFNSSINRFILISRTGATIVFKDVDATFSSVLPSIGDVLAVSRETLVNGFYIGNVPQNGDGAGGAISGITTAMAAGIRAHYTSVLKNITASNSDASGNSNTFFVNRKYTGARLGTSYNAQLAEAERGNSLKPFPDVWSARDAANTYLAANPTFKATGVLMSGNKYTFGTDAGVDFAVTAADAVKNYGTVATAQRSPLSQDIGINRLNWHFETNTTIEYKGSGQQIGANSIYPALFMTPSNWKALGVAPFFQFDSNRDNDTFDVTGHLRFVDTINYDVANIYNNMGFSAILSDSSLVNIETDGIESNTMFLNVHSGSGVFKCKNTNRYSTGFLYNTESQPIILGGNLETLPKASLKSQVLEFGNFYTGDAQIDGQNVYTSKSGNGATNYKRSPFSVANVRNVKQSVVLKNVIHQSTGKFLSYARVDSVHLNMEIDNFFGYRNSNDYAIETVGGSAAEAQAIPEFQFRDTIRNSTWHLKINSVDVEKTLALISSLNFVKSKIVIEVGNANKRYNINAPIGNDSFVNYLPLIDINNWWADSTSSIVFKGGIFESDSSPIVRVKGTKNNGSIIFDGCTFKTKSKRFPAVLINTGGQTEANRVIEFKNCKLWSNFTSSLFVDNGSAGTPTEIYCNGILANKQILGNVITTGQTPNIIPSLKY